MGLRRSALIGVAASLLALGTSTTTAGAVRATDGVNAILLDPYDGCTVQDAWATLNANWSKYGSIPLSITTGGNLCQGTFTLADLQASGADTVILDLTAYNSTLTSDEIQALQTYLNEGHKLFGQSTVFQCDNRHSNHGLAPLFGLADESSWFKIDLGERPVHYKLRKHDPDAAVLLRNDSNPT